MRPATAPRVLLAAWMTVTVSLTPHLAMASVDGGESAQNTSTTVSATNLATLALAGKTITVGVGYLQNTYKSQLSTNSSATTTLTDNGAPNLVFDISGPDKVIRAWPMLTGNAVLGWGYTGTLGRFDTRYQIISNALRGQDVGTEVTGYYLGVAPVLFLRLGPLSGHQPIFWRFAVGLGPGLVRASGSAIYASQTPSGIYEQLGDAGSSASVAGVYEYGTCDLRIGHWDYAFTGKSVTHLNGRPAILSYGFTVSYRFKW